eukprot:NODE_1308_length_1003_cov_1362.149895_g910_i0.p1 GENE.NODE_1308_length_1003_cov_1362.149895_g910_i0~~NODE_1308_length_1003_cov_1362.149895_g910_i0.p1  ORF type:complete len:213 (+),score=44.55 NODE_1308_length_1003_cov_1362.149895_g910_i0:74-712(+)
MSTGHLNKHSDFDHLVKTVVIGDAGVGKTSLLLRYTDDIFDYNYLATIGVDFRIQTLEENGQLVKMQIWDTAGQERFRTITRGYYRGASAVLLCFDLTDAESFQHCASWVKDVEAYCSADCVVFLIGTKADQTDRRVVSQAEATAFAEENGMKYVETSAKRNQGVEGAFREVITGVLDRRAKTPAPKMPTSLNLAGAQRLTEKKRRCFFWPF